MKTRIFTIFCLLFGLFLLNSSLRAQDTRFRITSPDGHIAVEVSWQDGLTWQAFYDATTITSPSAIRMDIRHNLDGQTITLGAPGKSHLRVADSRLVSRMMPQPTYVKRAVVKDEYTLRLFTDSIDNYSIEWRVYNDGVAYRLILPKLGDLYIMDETAEYRFGGDWEVIVPYENDCRNKQTMCCSFESYYDHQTLSTMHPDSLCFTPLCITLPNGLRVIPAETDLYEYPGMFLHKGEGNSLRAVFPHVPADFAATGYADYNLIPASRQDYIAHSGGTGNQWVSPWRAVGIFPNDAAILNSDLMQCLAQADILPLRQERGIFCGQSVWDWWNDWDLEGVDFKPGINQPTYEYFARFAAANHIRYMIVDDGWSEHGDLMKTIGELNIPSLVRYADSLHVGVILWSTYRALRENTEATMAHYAKMGVKGFKIDFFDRNDQCITDDVWRLAEVAERYGLLIDLHGYMPTGIQAVYPNVMSFEGVKGLENFKWEKMAGDRTEHDHPLNVVMVPFLRGFIGPYDYTPGSMRNATYAEFAKGGLKTIGTRANQLAMYIVMEAPLQMLADSPTEYEKNSAQEQNADALSFITRVPTIFDETVVLDAKLGEYIVIARRSGTKWYIGAVTREARTIHLSLSFLSKGRHTIHAVSDGPNAAFVAKDAVYSTKRIGNSKTLTLHLAPAGGYAAIIE